ncbi:MAG TPA: bifunctional hydroxymethylpyrimidine kinase/phosphomethylpyrimidine kinase [Candidatus Hydrogenedentes bacterium]|nr:bifunctional hydroxymethylpyrimidine kinase/phosphomethylpyrimidine kinase [Candidatus Hydrogenedentota bacterium]HOV74209.1 bifunctional hydroxymethylpyrimidine kinase/phosphomethylpyrimidine kinase [Candidatus Hydrogenedentota bacterium]HPC15751.1 bifunctional hydroxymethylpyrimidine kinase/phosphomethylpyrimidine kinase [Candidatus Hydrogenedentota bacterium]HRT19625.1 bifunctional hydroxymethylpyrimidine kinase/phosphomethylpyrimidine kinase [Candidatus Hydrogenedentota bacterium]HRT6440
MSPKDEIAPLRGVCCALTIAGSDSGGGAGIEADLKTFAMLGVHGMAAVTAVTAQNTVAVTDIFDLPPAFVAGQIRAVAEDIGIDAAKTGMLSNAHIVEAVAEAIRAHDIRNLVVDPVMVAKSGDTLLRADARNALCNRLLPHALIVMPNIPEAEILANRRIASADDIPDAAKRIHAFGPKYVLIKGGHLQQDVARDYLFDGFAQRTFDAPRIETRNTHGTGCTYSAAVTACLARGYDVPDAVQRAKEYLTEAIRQSYPLGHGHGALNHAWPLEW